VPCELKHGAEGGVGMLSWDELERQLDSQELLVVARSPSGVRVAVDDKAGGSLTERSRLAVARALQLADRSLPDAVALQRADYALLRCLGAVVAAAPAFLAAGTSVLRGATDHVVLSAPSTARRRCQTVTLRVAVRQWGGAGAFGLGVDITVHGRLTALLRGPEPSIGGAELGSSEVGQFRCTVTTGWPLCATERVGVGPWEDPEASVSHSVRLKWTQAAAAEEGEEWADAEDSGELSDATAQPPVTRNACERRSRAHALQARKPAATSELLCWGDNEHGELSDVDHSVLPSPVPLSWAPLAPWEQVHKVATSARHTVLCTSVGSVYTCGDGADGALGHGTMQPSRTLKLVLWFADGANGRAAGAPVEVRDVGAGADLFGSHTVALDATGRIYTWGIGSACGRGNRKPEPEPAVVDFFEATGEVAGSLPAGASSGDSGGDPDGGEAREHIVAVACGGGYCMAINAKGALWTWGNWTGGRLGLGPVPSKVDNSYLHAGTRKRMLPLLLRPKRVTGGGVGEAVVVQVACGDAHTLARSAEGHVFAWGQNESGQLGVGPAQTGVLEIEFLPRALPFGAAVRFVACGAAHSLAIDAEGDVWTWGGAGASCVGHPADGGHAKHTFRPTTELQAARAVRQRANEAFVEALPWAVPRRVEALCGRHDCAVAAGLGERHSVVLLQSGRAMMCGDGMALVHQLAHAGDDPAADPEAALEALEAHEPVSTPRLPCARWFPALDGKNLAVVACGGQHTIVLAKGERLGLTLGYSLLQAARRARLRLGGTAPEEPASDEEDSGGAGGGAGSGKGSYDLVMVTAGSVLAAHRMVLSVRSKVLRELIAEEERPGSGRVLELLLPDLKHDTAVALRDFLYMDTLARPLEPGSSLPHDLLAAAITYDLPRLAVIAARAIPAAALPPALARLGGAGSALPPSTLASDLACGLGDNSWADVKFVAGGRAIFAHRAVLVAASEYFAAMFRHQGVLGSGEEEDGDEDEGGRPPLVEIVVPDSHVGMLRLLLFIYTGHVEGADEGAVLEDLLAADRFQLAGMMASCESLLEVSPHNCLRILEVATLVDAGRLKQVR